MINNEDGTPKTKSVAQQISPTSRQKKKSLSKLVMRKKSSSASEEEGVLPSAEVFPAGKEVCSLPSAPEEIVPENKTCSSSVQPLLENVTSNKPDRTKVVDSKLGESEPTSGNKEKLCAHSSQGQETNVDKPQCSTESASGYGHSEKVLPVEVEVVVNKNSSHASCSLNSIVPESPVSSPSTNGLSSRARVSRRQMLTRSDRKYSSTQSIFSRGSDDCLLKTSKSDNDLCEDYHSVTSNGSSEKSREEMCEVLEDVVTSQPSSSTKRGSNVSRKDSRSADVPGTYARTSTPTMDNLARQSLLAARVLHVIPTQKARERNYLQGRIASTSLLGPSELEKAFPTREVQIFIGTWNMHGQLPPKELNDFVLPDCLEHVPDIFTIGTQETIPEKTEWEVRIQETLGPSHVLFCSTSLGTLHLAVFMRRDLIWFCSEPEEANLSTRAGTAFKTKGAVAISFMLFGTSFLFLTCHLTAHKEKVKERMNDVKMIIKAFDLPKSLQVKNKSKDVTENFDCVFWCGDLNFRLSQTRETVIEWVSSQRFPRVCPVELHDDQLRKILVQGSVFRGFEEGPITFAPSYKYDAGTNQFDTSSKQRTPAYTDRILFKHNRNTEVHCLMYQSATSIRTSDHKPVWGLYSSSIRPGRDTIPLAAGLFNREVYLEGMKRRVAAMTSKQSSAVCEIQ